jgi:hypothetical protein
MAEIRVNVTASKSQRVNVSSSNIATEITATPDTSQYYSNLAKNWAIAENIVNNEDYSSKHYAKEAQQASELANTYKEATEQAYVSFSEQYANAETELTSIKDASVQEINTAVTDGKTEITTTKDLAIDAVNNTKTTILQDIEFVADGEKEEIRDLADDIKENANDIINRVSLSMFDTILKDHILTYEETKGLALQGTYVYKEAVAGSRYGYPDFYAKVIEEYNQATTTETVNGVTIKVHSNGHKFYDIADKNAIDNSFNSLGTAWFYGVDTANECIFLPRNNYITSYITNGNKTVSIKGNGTNIGVIRGVRDISGNGVFGSAQDTGTGTAYWATNPTTPVGVTTDASKSGITGTVNITNSQTGMYLYICVGNTVSDTSWVDVVTQVEGGVKDLEDKKNTSIAEIDANAKSYDNLTYRQITNCLLEVPQRIKYTLADGTLTILAGSVAIFPYGTEDKTEQLPVGSTFLNDNLKVVDTCWDGAKFFVWAELQSGFPRKSTYNTTDFIYLDRNGSNLRTPTNTACSGSTADTTLGRYIFWYDTTNNYVKFSVDNGATWNTNNSLPLVIAQGNSTTGYTSIQHTFNGFGYIGSTIWVDKGVKGLIPNGRNEDGTLKNVEFILDKVITRTFASTDNNSSVLYLNSSMIGRESAKNTIYNELLNRNFSNGSVWSFAHIGSFTTTNGVISNFQPKQPFRAVDYNDALLKSDKSEIVSWGMPSNYQTTLTVGASGTSYTAPASGYFMARMSAGKANEYNQLYCSITGLNIVYNAVAASNEINIYMPVKKGDVVKHTYNTTGSIKQLKFIYAEGDQ